MVKFTVGQVLDHGREDSWQSRKPSIRYSHAHETYLVPETSRHEPVHVPYGLEITVAVLVKTNVPNGVVSVPLLGMLVEP